MGFWWYKFIHVGCVIQNFNNIFAFGCCLRMLMIAVYVNPTILSICFRERITAYGAKPTQHTDVGDADEWALQYPKDASACLSFLGVLIQESASNLKYREHSSHRAEFLFSILIQQLPIIFYARHIVDGPCGTSYACFTKIANIYKSYLCPQRSATGNI